MPVKNDREIQCERDVVRRLTAGAGAGADAPVESSAFARALNGTAEEGFRRFEVGVQDWFRRLVHQEPPVGGHGGGILLSSPDYERPYV